MKGEAVSALRSKRGLHRMNGAEPPVVGLTPQTTQERSANTMKTYLLRDPKTVEPQSTACRAPRARQPLNPQLSTLNRLRVRAAGADVRGGKKRGGGGAAGDDGGRLGFRRGNRGQKQKARRQLRENFAGRVQQRMERTLRATSPHDKTTSASRSGPFRSLGG
jgi:hypothetical protein